MDDISRLRYDIFLTTLWAALVPFIIITSLGVGWEFWGRSHDLQGEWRGNSRC